MYQAIIILHYFSDTKDSVLTFSIKMKPKHVNVCWFPPALRKKNHVPDLNHRHFNFITLYSPLNSYLQ